MIKIVIDNDKKLKNEIDVGLTKFNREKCEWLKVNSDIVVDEYQEKEFNFLAYDDNKLIGGAIGFVKYDWYFLDMLYITEEYRNIKIGTMLINELEIFAQKEKLIGIFCFRIIIADKTTETNCAKTVASAAPATSK